MKLTRPSSSLYLRMLSSSIDKVLAPVLLVSNSNFSEAGWEYAGVILSLVTKVYLLTVMQNPGRSRGFLGWYLGEFVSVLNLDALEEAKGSVCDWLQEKEKLKLLSLNLSKAIRWEFGWKYRERVVRWILPSSLNGNYRSNSLERNLHSIDEIKYSWSSRYSKLKCLAGLGNCGNLVKIIFSKDYAWDQLGTA